MSVFFSTLQLFNIGRNKSPKLWSKSIIFGARGAFGGGCQKMKFSANLGVWRGKLFGKNRGNFRSIFEEKAPLFGKFQGPFCCRFFAKKRSHSGAKTDKKEATFRRKKRQKKKIFSPKIVDYSKKSYLYKNNYTRVARALKL